jgi:dCMP deaminase
MDWHEYFFSLIPVLASKSKDPSSKVSCIFVGKNNEILATGFNGFPIGVNDDPARYNDRETKYLYVVHSEINAICIAARNGISLEGSTLYLEWYPCNECTKAIISVNCKKIIINTKSKQYNDIELQKRWKTKTDISLTMLKEAGVEIVLW